MSAIIAWLITALVVVLLAAFVQYIRGLRSLPLQERPSTRTYDRFGGFIGMMENPDYRENPGENPGENAGENPGENPAASP